MGDDVRLQCSKTKTCSGTDELQAVFLNRFKLPDDFWEDLLKNSYPEELSCRKQSITNLPNSTPTPLNNSHDSFKTPKSLSVVKNGKLYLDNENLETVQVKPGYSPSLFSPNDCCQNGMVKVLPSSSTPLPMRPLEDFDAALCQTGTKIPNKGFKTPVTALLNERYNGQDTTLKVTRSLSASLEMDSVGYISWTSSLATPPKAIEITDGCDVVENNCEISKNRTSKGVARVLFQKQSQDLKQTFTCDNTRSDDNDMLQSSLCMDREESLNKEEETGGNDSFEIQYISCEEEACVMAISPIMNLTQSKMDKSFRSPDYFNDSVEKVLDNLPIMTGIPKSIASGEDRCIERLDSMSCKNKATHVETENITNVNSGNLANAALKNTSTSMENIYDMDTLSELPFDYVTPERNKEFLNSDVVRERHENSTKSYKPRTVTRAQTKCDTERTSPGEQCTSEGHDSIASQNKPRIRELETASQILFDLNSRFCDIIHDGIDDLGLPYSSVQFKFVNNCVGDKHAGNHNTANTEVIEEKHAEKISEVESKETNRNWLESHVKIGKFQDPNVSCKFADDYDSNDQYVTYSKFNKEIVCKSSEKGDELITDKFQLRNPKIDEPINVRDYIQCSPEKGNLKQKFEAIDNVSIDAHGDLNNNLLVSHAYWNPISVSEEQRESREANSEIITNFKTIGEDSTSDDIVNKGKNFEAVLSNAENSRNEFRTTSSGRTEIGFMTASGKGIKLSERALEKAKSILKEIDKEGSSENDRTCVSWELNGMKDKPTEIINVGFSTASGKKVVISDTAMERARKFLADDNEARKSETYRDNVVRKSLEKENGVGTFGNMKKKITCNSTDGKEIDCVESRTTNSHAVRSLCIGQNQDKRIDPHGRVEVGFSTASGKKVVISEKAIEEARKPLNEEVCCEKFENPLSSNNIKECGTNIHSGMEDSRNISDQGKETGSHARERTGFSTASGKKVVISEKAIEQARDFLAGIPVEASSYKESGKSSPINDIKTRKISRQDAIEFSDVSNKENAVTSHTADGFSISTASGKKVVISEKAIEREREFLSKEHDISEDILKGQNINRTNPEEKIGVGFSTASGKKVVISEKAIEQARKFLSEENNISADSRHKINNIGQNNIQNRENDVETTKAVTCPRRISVGDKMRKTPGVSDFDVTNSSTDGHIQENGDDSHKITQVGFSTASGNKVVISEKAIEKARQFLAVGDCDDLNGTLPRKNHEKVGFQTASGKKVNISEKSISKARKFLATVNELEQRPDNYDSESHLTGIRETKTAAKDATISDKSVEKAKAILNKVDKLNINLQPESRSDINMENLGKPEEHSNSDHHFLSAFSTASRKGVHVTKKALRKATSILVQVDDSLNESDTSVTKQRMVAEAKLSENVYRCVVTGFQTAGGMGVCISEKALEKGKAILKEVEDTIRKKADYADSNCISDYGKMSHSIAANMSLHEITASDKLRHEAKKLTNDISDGNGSPLTDEKTENDSNSIRHAHPKVNSRNLSTYSESIEMTCVDDAAELPKLQFSTASGSDVVVSKEALEDAKNILNDVSHVDPLNNVRCEQNEILPSANVPSKNECNKCTENESMTHGVNTTPLLENTKTTALAIATHSNFEDMSERTRNEISESSSMLCLDEPFMDLSQILGCRTDSKEVERKNNMSCGSETTKRLLETEYENVPPCKFSRMKEEPNDKNIGKTSGQQSSRVIRKPCNANPIEVYCDRPYSNLRSPMQPLVVSPSNRSALSREPKTGYCTPENDKQNHSTSGSKCNESMNRQTPCKRKSRFVTPYRRKARENSEKNESSINMKSKTRKGRTDSKRDKQPSNKAVPGSIFKLRNSQSFKRIPLRVYVGNVSVTHSTTELLQLGVKPSMLSIFGSNAGSYRFKACDYLSNAACKANSGVRFTDGAVVLLGEDKCIGIEELSRAFMSSPGVDSSLIDERWVANHYKWIVWKLASYEVAYPRYFLGRCLSPDMILRQLKYRYDREVDRCERSAVKKILERDDAASRAMVLCVSDLNIPDEKLNEGEHKPQVPAGKYRYISMTDGWYSIRIQLDGYLKGLVDAGKIFTGQKLYTQGAELVGSDQAVSPLEAPSNLCLRIHGNSTRPAKNFSRLGFHCTNNIFTVPVKSLSCDGGLVGCILVIVSRQYPLQFMEKQPDGGCVFRNPRCEERVAKIFEKDVQVKRENIMHRVQREMEKEETETKKPKRRKTGVSPSEKIIGLFDGKELYDVINNATDPCSIQNSLSDEQARIVEKYKRSVQENKTLQMRQRYEEAWKKLCEEETLERNVVPVLKVKLIDNMPQKNNESPGTALLTVWRPSEHIITTLEEGKRLKIYNTYASRYSKGSNTIQLSANRSTIYKEAPNNTKYQCDFQPRKVYDIDELSYDIKPGTEVDIVAVVISFRTNENLTTVYLSDSCFNFVRLKIWRGLEEQALENIIKERIIIAACNLVYQPDKYCGIPSLKYYELSVITTNPPNKILKGRLSGLKNTIENMDTFVLAAKAKLEEICSKSTPAGSSRPCQTSEKSGISPAIGSEGFRHSRKRLLQLKRKKLDLLPDPPPLSPLPNATTPNVRKEYKIPRRVATESKENE